MSVDEKESETEKIVEELVLAYDTELVNDKHNVPPERREQLLSDWSGADGYVYREFDNNNNDIVLDLDLDYY